MQEYHLNMVVRELFAGNEAFESRPQSSENHECFYLEK